MSTWEIGEDEWPEPETTGEVLIVDDDASIRTMLAFVFDDAGYRVWRRPTGGRRSTSSAPSRPRW